MDIERLQSIVRERGRQWGKVPLHFRVIELGGEAGEVLNAYKKFERAQLGMAGGGPLVDVQAEVCDVIISAVALANELCMDLDIEIKNKFDETSIGKGLPTWRELDDRID